jgi:DNA-binding response OmpR family regulator
MKKILIVDDEPHVSLVLKQFLERAGWQVFSTLNGELAIDLINKEQPDAVISDVYMPKMSGIELFDFIHQKMPGYRPLLVLMTSRTDRDIRAWIAQQNRIEMMTKPISMRRLLARINDFSANRDS